MYTTDKAKELSTRLESLAQNIITDPAALANFSKSWSNGFHQYSMQNWLLIYMQNKNASLCASYRQWQKVKRHVVSGQHGMMILVPMIKKLNQAADDDDSQAADDMPAQALVGFTTGYVFDISQTDGEPLDIGSSKLVKGQASITLDDIRKAFPKYTYNRYELGAHEMAEGWTDGGSINTAKHDNNPAAEIAVTFHELAHCELGHTVKGGMLTDGHTLSRSIKELEAEAVSYIVSSHFGIENGASALYLGNWKASPELVNAQSSRILKVAGAIIKALTPKPEASQS